MLIAMHDLVLVLFVLAFVGGFIWAMIQAYEEIEEVNEPRTYVHRGRRIKR